MSSMTTVLIFLLTVVFFSPIKINADVALANAVIPQLSSWQQQQGERCALRQTLSAPHIGWVASDVVPGLKLIFQAYSKVSLDKVTTTWLCDTIKVWSLIVDQAYHYRSCTPGSDKWCSYNTADLTLPNPAPRYCTAQFCGKNPGAVCRTGANWKAKCIKTSNRCPIVCFHIKGTNYAAYKSFTNYLYSLTWNYKKRTLNEQVKRILSNTKSNQLTDVNSEETNDKRTSTSLKRIILDQRSKFASKIMGSAKRSEKVDDTQLTASSDKRQSGRTCTSECGWCDSWTGDCGSVCSANGAATGDPCMYGSRCCICIIY